MTTPTIEDLEKDIKEAVIAAYPEDLWPTPEDTSHLKNANVAYIMREMSGAVASIARQVAEQYLTTAHEQGKEEERKEIVQGLPLAKLPYSYKRKSPFPGESVDFHLKMYGHLPEIGCCEFDQYTDEEVDIYNKAISKVISILTQPTNTKEI